MTAFEIFDWLELTALGSAIRDSAWLFPVIESVHLLGLAMLGGAVLIVDLRLLGVGLTAQSRRYVLAQATPWLLGALFLMFMTVVPLFLSEALKCYFRPAFWIKMGSLGVALVFTFALRNRIVRSQPNLSRSRAAALALCSLVLWFTVAAAGRWIGFS